MDAGDGDGRTLAGEEERRAAMRMVSAARMDGQPSEGEGEGGRRAAGGCGLRGAAAGRRAIGPKWKGILANWFCYEFSPSFPLSKPAFPVTHGALGTQTAMTAAPHEDDTLWAASARGDVAAVDRLLAAGVSDVDAEDPAAPAKYDVRGRRTCMNRTAIGLASEGGHLAVVEHLLAAGANPRRGHAARALRFASGNGHLAVVERLLEEGVDVHTGADDALRSASEHGHLRVVERLIAVGADLHAQNEDALRLASENGHLAMVEWLLANGADVNGKDDDDTALTLASEHGHLAVVERLLAAGADVHCVDDWALRKACEGNHVEIAERLLAAGANANVWDDTLLVDAQRWCEYELMALLFRYGANVDRLRWQGDETHWPLIVQTIPRELLPRLPDMVKAVWIRFNVRVRARLQRALRRARDRLDRPPRSRLGDACPTRAELIAHLQTAGRRFAREYWVEGIPIFFPGMDADLGPLPCEFQEPTLGSTRSRA